MGRLLAIVGFLLSFALIVWLGFTMEWARVALSLKSIRFAPFAGICLCVALAIWLRSWRLKIISSGAPGKRQPLVAFWDATTVMYFGNAIYPGRIGEVMRAWALHQWASLPPGHAASAVVADRLSDTFVVGLFALLAIALFGLGQHRLHVAWPVLLLVFIPIACMVALVRYGEGIGHLLARYSHKFPLGLADRIPRWYNQALVSSVSLRSPVTLFSVLLVSTSAVLLDYAAFWFGTKAMGWDLPFQAAVIAGVFVAIGTLIPSAPSSLGVYQLACVLALQRFGIAESEAVAFSLAVQLASLATISLGGALTIFRRGAGALKAANASRNT
jgi:glycosyltransferase 2 family protein